MRKFKWNGTGPIHTPSGVVEPGKTFKASTEWLAGFPQRKWLKTGVIEEVEGRKAKK